jgi:hypothetical protein
VGAVAEAPPATAKEIPAAPSTGKLVFVRFRLEGCFACAMVTPLGEYALVKRENPNLVPSRSCKWGDHRPYSLGARKSKRPQSRAEASWETCSPVGSKFRL